MRLACISEMAVTAVESTYKLGQNKSDPARNAAAEAMRSAEIGQEVAVLAAMMQSVDRDP